MALRRWTRRYSSQRDESHHPQNRDAPGGAAGEYFGVQAGNDVAKTSTHGSKYRRTPSVALIESEHS
jgi:hypothetical protein